MGRTHSPQELRRTGAVAPRPFKTKGFVFSAAVALALGAVTTMPACEYDSPPRPSLDGLVEGVLPDPRAPIVLVFSEPVDPNSVSVKIAPFEVDAEGNLGDEDAEDAGTELNPFFTYSDLESSGGDAVLTDDRRALVIYPAVTLPLAASLVLLVEPHLKDDAGRETMTRQRLLFSYKFSCESATASTLFQSGVYFMVVNVDKPIPTQIQLYAQLTADEMGQVRASFVNADRNPDKARCTPACDESTTCQTLPGPPMCVMPSAKAGTEDEYPDFVVNGDPPVGYKFGALGCISEANGTVSFVSEPTDVHIQQPAVIVQAAVLTASLKLDGQNVLRGTGSLASPAVFLGSVDTPTLGEGSGSLSLRLVPPDEAPTNIPPFED
ncbi:MAG: hypothetical protein U0414_14220 [Polyangiaceae bacterium]